MDPQIIAAIIGGIATVIGAVIAAVLGIRASRRRGATESGGASTQSDSPQAARPPRKGELQIHVVDSVEGDFATISEAIRAAAPKDKILVRPGWYREGIVVDKPLDIVGDGNTEDTVVLSDGNAALKFSTTAGRVSNLTLRQVNREARAYAVHIGQGRLRLTGCDISNRSMSGVGIYDGADPILRGNRIYDNKESGVYLYNNGLGVLEENDILDNGLSGVEVTTGGNPFVHNNRINDNNGCGLKVHGGGKGMFEGNDIFANSLTGVYIEGEGSDPTLRNNRIRDSKQSGVASSGGKGTLEDNDIFNSRWGVQIRDEGSDPTLRNNRIHDNEGSGVLVNFGGKGTLDNNEIVDNAASGMAISLGGDPTVRNNRIYENRDWAVRVFSQGSGTIEGNNLSGNARGAFDVSDDSESNFIRNNNKT
jgi:parallel beta-helix repeat protein